MPPHRRFGADLMPRRGRARRQPQSVGVSTTRVNDFMADHTKTPPPAAATEPSDGNAPGDPNAKQQPVWNDWRRRPTISVQDGVRLAHNIKPSSEVWKTLKDAADPRVPLVGSACRTASLSMATDPRLWPIREPLAERQRHRLRQKVGIHSFATWAIETIDNPHMSPEFRALATAIQAPRSPKDTDADPWDRSIEILRTKYPLETPTAVTKRLQSVAKLLVAVAVDKYGLEVTEAGEKFNGTLAAFQRVTGDAGFKATDSDTISDALSLAVDLVGREKVVTAMSNRTVRRKR